MDAITSEKIRRARLSGPSQVTANATVAEMDVKGRLTILAKGTNEWVCFPGNENIIGDVPMAVDPMGMQWLMDLQARKPKPTNSSPGLIYMLCGALQHSYTDPFDRTSPPIPIGPHWMVLWPFDAAAAGLGTVMRDAGTMVMFAGTPYAHLHICGSPWDGNEYRRSDRVIRTLTYSRTRMHLLLAQIEPLNREPKSILALLKSVDRISADFSRPPAGIGRSSPRRYRLDHKLTDCYRFAVLVAPSPLLPGLNLPD